MTLIITPTPEAATDDHPPRIRLSVAGSSATPNPVGAFSSVAVFRDDPDGERRRVLIDRDATLSAGTTAVFDYHAPFNQSVSYVAVVDQRTSSPASITLPSTVSWLIHPNNPALSTPVTAINEVGDRVRASTAVLSAAYGSKYPISLWEGTRRSVAGSLVVRLGSEREARAVDQLLDDSGPVLLNLAVAELAPAWWDESWAWVQPGDTTYSNPSGSSIYYQYRHLAFPYTVVDTPAGVEVPIWTVNDLMEECATGLDVLAKYRTVLDLATNTQSTAGGGVGLLAPTEEPGFYSGSAVEPEAGHSGYFVVDVSDGSA
jgi:hypothetical protein